MNNAKWSDRGATGSGYTVCDGAECVGEDNVWVFSLVSLPMLAD
jgi:hypothetical protein